MRSDEALVEALLLGDLQSFDLLYERYCQRLLGFIRHYVKNPADAEEILHETFLAILRDRSSLQRAHSVRAWIFQVARNLSLIHLRARRRAARALALEASVTDEVAVDLGASVDARRIHTALYAAIDKLPIEFAEVFRLRSEGMSYEEMAEVLLVPLGTVKSRLHRMVALLREEMSP